jgi:hypothetical protein
MELKLYKSPWRAIKLILLCSVFVFVGIFLLRYSDAPKWVGWMSIIFFGLGYPVGLFHLFDRRPQIIINEVGIFDRMAYGDFINWEVIRGAYPIDIHGQKLVCLVVDEVFEPKIKKKDYIKKFSKDIGAQELNIALGQIKVDETKLTEFILTMISVAPQNRKKEINNRRQL